MVMMVEWCEPIQNREYEWRPLNPTSDSAASSPSLSSGSSTSHYQQSGSNSPQDLSLDSSLSGSEDLPIGDRLTQDLPCGSRSQEYSSLNPSWSQDLRADFRCLQDLPDGTSSTSQSIPPGTSNIQNLPAGSCSSHSLPPGSSCIYYLLAGSSWLHDLPVCSGWTHVLQDEPLQIERTDAFFCDGPGAREQKTEM